MTDTRRLREHRKPLQPGTRAWRIATAVREFVIHGARDRFPGGYDLVWYVEDELDALDRLDSHEKADGPPR